MNQVRELSADRVIHIGAPKCGSTALQSAFFRNREAMQAEGVHYVSEGAHWKSAAKAAVGAADRYSGKVPPRSEWERLVKSVASVANGTALISSEWFAGANEDRVQHIVADLDPARLRAVLVVRPLTSTLPSAWQQGLKLGGKQNFSEWLNTVLRHPQDPLSKRVWSKHRYDLVAQRWATALGKERLSVIVADESSPAFIFSAFSQVLGLSDGTLSAPPKRTNPSLSAFEADTLAELNRIYFERGGTVYGYRSGVLQTFDGYVNSLRSGTVQRSGVPLEDVPAVQQLNEQIAQGIRDAGCTVIGDLDRFAAARSVAQSGESNSGSVGEQRATDVRSAAGMIYALMVTTGVAEVATSLPGFGTKRALLTYQARSLARRVAQAIVGAVKRRLP